MFYSLVNIEITLRNEGEIKVTHKEVEMKNVWLKKNNPKMKLQKEKV